MPESAIRPEPCRQPLRARWLGRQPYEPTWRAMQAYTEARDQNTPDELWLLEHPPVFTLGMNADPAHVLDAGSIDVVRVDRGGQVTYHGPGQLMVYPLLDLRRRERAVRWLVSALESAVVDYLAALGYRAAARADAPGVYVSGAKIASVGIRVRKNGSYHGLAFNVAMDLAPFARINPCGYAGLAMTDLATLGTQQSVAASAANLLPCLARRLEVDEPPLSRDGFLPFGSAAH
ncbi:MAG: lipoyl(octanoyl) transferase LipB [Steroidobacteraceae bacterium]